MPNVYIIGGANGSSHTTVASCIYLYVTLGLSMNNTNDNPQLAAERPLNQQPIIYQPSIWQRITEVAHD